MKFQTRPSEEGDAGKDHYAKQHVPHIQQALKIYMCIILTLELYYSAALLSPDNVVVQTNVED